MDTQAIDIAFEAKVRKGIFRPVDRFLSDRKEAADRMQDAIAATWLMYRRYALEKGQVLPDAILVHACRQHAVNPNRHFVPAGGRKSRRKDVLNPVCFQLGRAELTQYNDEFPPVGLAEMAAADPQDKLISAMDLEAWARNLSEEDRQIMAGKMAGETTRKVAQRFKRRTYKEVWNREKQLGRELAERCGVEIRCGKERTRKRAAAAR